MKLAREKAAQGKNLKKRIAKKEDIRNIIVREMSKIKIKKIEVEEVLNVTKRITVTVSVNLVNKKQYNFNRIFILGSDVIEIPIAPEPPLISKAARTPSPIPADGAGDCLSIDDTNKLRAKLGLKPLEVGSSEVQSSTSKNDDENEEVDESVADLKRIKDDWGEFYHKPAGTHNEKSEVQKLRDKIREKRDKRKIEQKLARVKTL